METTEIVAIAFGILCLIGLAGSITALVLFARALERDAKTRRRIYTATVKRVYELWFVFSRDVVIELDNKTKLRVVGARKKQYPLIPGQQYEIVTDGFDRPLSWQRL